MNKRHLFFFASGVLCLALLSVFSACSKFANIPENELKPDVFFSEYNQSESVVLQLTGPWQTILPLKREFLRYNGDYLHDMEEFTISSERMRFSVDEAFGVDIVFNGFPGKMSKDGRLKIDSQNAVGSVRLCYYYRDLCFIYEEVSDFSLIGSLNSNDEDTSLTGSLTLCATNSDGQSFKVALKEVALLYNGV